MQNFAGVHVQRRDGSGHFERHVESPSPIGKGYNYFLPIMVALVPTLSSNQSTLTSILDSFGRVPGNQHKEKFRCRRNPFWATMVESPPSLTFTKKPQKSRSMAP